MRKLLKTLTRGSSHYFLKGSVEITLSFSCQQIECGNVLSRSDPARPLMTVTGFLGSVQNCSSTGEKASRLLSNYTGKQIMLVHK